MFKDKAINLFNKIFHRARPQTKMEIFKAFLIRRKKLLSIIAAALLGLLVLLFLFNLYQKSAQEKYSAIFHQSLIEEERGNIDGAKEGLQKIYDAKFAPSGVKGIASLRYAGILLNTGGEDEALKIYTEIAKSSRYNPFLRELSGLLATKILVIKTTASSDKTAWPETLQQIEKFESRSKILNFYFTEQKGIFLMKTGDLEKSYQSFATIIKDPAAEQALKLRAADMVKLLVAEGYVAKAQ